MNVFYVSDKGGVADQIDHWGNGPRTHAAARILGLRKNGYKVRTVTKGKAWSIVKFRDVPYSGYLRIGDDEELAAYRWSEKYAAALRASAREREMTVR